MKYCRYHDFGFCPDHEDCCLAPTCVLVERTDVYLCAVCVGMLFTDNLRKPRKELYSAEDRETTTPEDHTTFDPDLAAE